MRSGKLFRSAKLRRKPAAGLSGDWYVVGLGNPGGKYAHTRHNAGFDVVSILAQRHAIPVRIHRYGARLGRGEIRGRRVLLCMPQTYMNRSGESVKELAAALGMRADQLVVVYDDVDLGTGSVRVKARGSAGSHNGMRSIISHLGTEEFVRVRVGIGRPGGDITEHVLGEYDDKQAAYDTLVKAADAVEALLAHGVAEAQSRFN